jgi:hypothetical protein
MCRLLDARGRHRAARVDAPSQSIVPDGERRFLNVRADP